MAIIQEEIENIAYDRSKNVNDSSIEYDTPADVKRHEDSWAGGNNIHNNINHLKAGGSKEDDVLGVERLVHPTMNEDYEISRRQLRAIILEAYKGKKFELAGRKIRSAGTSIRELADDQTGDMRKTLHNVSEFVEKLGHALENVRGLDEGASVESNLPTVSELKQLINAIKKLEK